MARLVPQRLIVHPKVAALAEIDLLRVALIILEGFERELDVESLGEGAADPAAIEFAGAVFAKQIDIDDASVRPRTALRQRARQGCAGDSAADNQSFNAVHVSPCYYFCHTGWSFEWLS